MKPWEKYASSDASPNKPWEKYQSQYPTQEDLTQLPDTSQWEEPDFSVGDYVRPLAQGLTFGWGDEIESAVTGKDVGQIRQEMDDFSEHNPWLSTVSEVAGAVPTMFIPGVGWTRGAGLVKNAGKLALEGAAYGGLSGMGTSEAETVGDVLSDGLVGAGIGAVGAPVVGAGLNKVAGKLGGSLQPDWNNVNHNRAFGRDTSLAERYPNTLGKLSNALDYSSGGAVAAKQKADQELDIATKALNDMASNPDMRAAQTSGQLYIDSVKDWIKTNEDHFENIYGNLRNTVDVNGKSIPTHTRRYLTSERAPFDGADAVGDIVEIPAIKRLRKALTPEEGRQPSLSFDALWKLRSDVGDALKTGKFGTDDVPQQKLKQLYASLSKDIEDNIFANGDNLRDYAGNKISSFEIVDQFDGVNKNYTKFLNDQSNLRNFFAKSNKDEYSPEKVISTLVRMFRDEPSQLAELRKLHEQAGIGQDLTNAGKGVLYQTALNRGEVDPMKALERYNIARGKTGAVDPVINTPTGDFVDGMSLSGRANSTSPARDLLGDSTATNQYEDAIYAARKAQQAVERGQATDTAQLIGSAAIPVIAGISNPATIPVYMAAQWIGTYGLRKVLNSGKAGEAIGLMLEELRKKPVGNLTPAEAQLMVAAYQSENE